MRIHEANIPVKFHDDAIAHFRRMTSTDHDLRLALNNAIVALDDLGIWEKMEVFNLVHDSQADSLLNMRNPVNGITDSSLSGSPSFTADRGFTCGATNRISTGRTVAQLVTSNTDCHLWAYSRTDITSSTGYPIFESSQELGFQVQSSFTVARMFGDDPLYSPADNSGFLGARKGSAAAGHLRHNDTVVQDASVGSGSTNSNTVYIGSDGSASASIEIAGYGFGSKITNSELATLENIIRAYMQARGADVY